MLTYQDLQKCGDDETLRRQFIVDKIAEQKQNPQYLEGLVAGEFYRGGDPDIQHFERVVYDMLGNGRVDEFSPNHKITTNFYNLFITQEINYLLGNGVSFDNESVKETLGNDFDYTLQDMTTLSANDGAAFVFLKKDGIELLNVGSDDEMPQFIPIYDLMDRDQPKAGIKHWRASDNSPLNVVLYEIDGYSEWAEVDGVLTVTTEKKPYDLKYMKNEIGERFNEQYARYDELPILPLYYMGRKSAIHNKKNLLNAYNLVLSGLVNNTTDINLLYWVIQNADGMDDVDYENYIANLYKSKILPLPDGVTAEPHQIVTDHAGHEATLEQLKKQLFADFMAVDTSNIESGNKTTVEIKAAYENLNLKCDALEKQVGRFVRKVLKFYGFDENEPFHFHRPNNINASEYVTMITQAAPILGDDVSLKLILEGLGMIDEYETIQRQRAADEMGRLTETGGE